jgi:pimeloyl-ACP methyl ester carboxylesterase
MSLLPTRRAIACSALISAFAFSFSGSSAHAGPFTDKKTEKPAAAKTAPARQVDAVFLHGLGGSPRGMPIPGLESALKQLGVALKIASPWLRPVEIDADGYAHGTGTHTMTDQLARARAEIEKHEGPVLLIGHSFGGKAGFELAKQMPGKVKGIIAIAPSVKMLYAYYKNLTGQKGLPERETVVARLAEHEHWLSGEVDKTDALAREARNHGEEDRAAGLSGKARSLRGELGYLKTMQDLALHDETKMELDVGVPVLMLHGIDDHAVSIHYARRFAEANPKVNLVEYPGIGHGLDSRNAKLERDAHQDMIGRIYGFLNELEGK